MCRLRQASSAATLSLAVLFFLLTGVGGGSDQGAFGGTDRQIIGFARVLYGDTIEIEGTRIRLHGIDAAEGGQTCGRAHTGTWDCAGAATARLMALTAGRVTVCEAVDQDRYGRTVAVCHVAGIDVQEVLAREGLAWAYRQYSREYIAAEEAARAERRGIWQGPAKPPWEWRRTQAASRPVISGQPTPDGCVIKGNINRKGERIFHTPASPWYDRTTVNTSQGQRWFCSEAEAMAAGWRPARW